MSKTNERMREPEPAIAAMKSWESAWIKGHITCGEYHLLLDLFGWALSRAEYRQREVQHVS